MKIQLIVALLLLMALADDQVIVKCFGCFGSSICMSFSGGGFGDNFQYKTSYNTCAETELSYPVTLDFTCDSDCDQGCLIQMIAPGMLPESFCSQTTEGRVYINYLDEYYSIQEGKTTTYDWCSCGLSIFVIILIVVGVLVAVALVGGAIYWFCIKKKRDDANYAAMRDQKY